VVGKVSERVAGHYVYGVNVAVSHYTVCLYKKSQSCAPEDGH
jgi:hypothetical protein